MNASMLNSIAAMQGMQTRINTIADNVANLNTTGYKRKETAFAEILTTIQQQHEDFELDGRKTPLGLPENWGARTVGMRFDMRQGALAHTGQPLDLALEGNAMFEIGVPRVDADGEPVLDDEDNPVLDRIWTRDGSFRLTVLPDDPVNVYLTTQHGRLVRDINDEPIAIPRNNRIEIDGNGNIIAHDDDNPLAAPLPVGQMKIVRVMRPQMLESIGENQFRLAGGLDDPEGILEVVDLNFREDETEGIHVRQGFIEQSNVDLSEEMTELITSQRALQFSARALASADTMMELTNRLRG